MRIIRWLICCARTEAGADDGGHQVAAEGRTGHLQVPVLHVPLLAVHVQRGGLAQELDVVGHVDVQVGAVSAQAGVQTGGAAGRQVTADVGGADQEGLGLHLLDDVADDLGIHLVVSLLELLVELVHLGYVLPKTGEADDL